ncbi:MAG: peptidoglycan-binding protein LysM [Flavobacterium stagni]
MIRKWTYYLTILLVIGFISSAFKPLDVSDHNWFYVDEQDELVYQLPSQNPNDYSNNTVPFTGKYFIGFKEALAFKESQGNYKKINTKGFMGKYQFGPQTLASIGIHNPAAFMRDPELQEKAFVALLKKHKWVLRDEIKQYRGKTIGGVYITESGILAAAHLGGPGSVRRFLKSNGERKCRDGYGTSVKTYMKRFGGYETHNLLAEKNPQVK